MKLLANRELSVAQSTRLQTCSPDPAPALLAPHFCVDNLSSIVTLSSASSGPSSDSDHNYLSKTLECGDQIRPSTEKAIVRSLNPRNPRGPSTHRPLLSAGSPSFPGSCDRFAKQLEQRSTSRSQDVSGPFLSETIELSVLEHPRCPSPAFGRLEARASTRVYL